MEVPSVEEERAVCASATSFWLCPPPNAHSAVDVHHCLTDESFQGWTAGLPPEAFVP
jgi:hypothetical protein